MATEPTTVARVCIQCSSEFTAIKPPRGRSRVLCQGCYTDRRKTAARRQYERRGGAAWMRTYYAEKLARHPTRANCAHCGAPFEGTRKRRYCSTRCSQRARDARLGVRPRDVVNAERAILASVECPQCCRSFKRTNYTKPSLYCSKRCAFSSRAWKAAVSHERTLYERWARRNRVPEWREAVLVRQIRRDLIGAIICYVHNPLLPCRECGEPMGSKHAKQRYCSTCGERRDKARKRAHESQRRARERMLPFDRFDPFEVLERDGWRCHMCGCKTPKRLRGSYAPNAPELDHIVPLAKGGPHTKANTACSCRKCNAAKGDKEYGQLRLLAA